MRYAQDIERALERFNRRMQPERLKSWRQFCLNSLEEDQPGQTGDQWRELGSKCVRPGSIPNGRNPNDLSAVCLDMICGLTTCVITAHYTTYTLSLEVVGVMGMPGGW